METMTCGQGIRKPPVVSIECGYFDEERSKNNRSSRNIKREGLLDRAYSKADQIMENEEYYVSEIEFLKKELGWKLIDAKEVAEHFSRLYKDVLGYDEIEIVNNLGWKFNLESLIEPRRINKELKWSLKELGKNVFRTIVTEFDERNNEFLMLGRNPKVGLNTLEEKRQELNALTNYYTTFSQWGLGRNRKISSYIKKLRKAKRIQGRLDKLTEKVENAERITSEDALAIKGIPFFNLFRLKKDYYPKPNLTSLESEARKIDYFEGNLRARELKGKIEDYLDYRFPVTRENKIVTEGIQENIVNSDYFVPAFLEISKNPFYSRIGKIYNGDTSASNWYERLKEMAEELKHMPKTKTEEDKTYLKTMYSNLKEFSENGYLAQKLRDFKDYRDVAADVFGRLESICC